MIKLIRHERHSRSNGLSDLYSVSILCIFNSLLLIPCSFALAQTAATFDVEFQAWRRAQAERDAMVFPKNSQQRVSLNRATAQQLQQGLVGVGPQKAQAIIAFRKQRGGFVQIEQLKEVPGIGEKLFEQNRARLSVE